MEHNRRITDPAEIENMIALESDPKDRAFLLILNNINKSLVSNTETIERVANQLDEHITKFETHTAGEEAMLNKGRGAWKVVAWVVGLIQAAGLAIWISSREEIKSIHESIHVDQVEHAVIKQRITALEAAK